MATAADTASEPKTLARQAQNLLRHDILGGQLRPGERLRTKEPPWLAWSRRAATTRWARSQPVPA